MSNSYYRILSFSASAFCFYVLGAGTSFSQMVDGCGDLNESPFADRRPLDYHDRANAIALRNVEANHFNEGVRTLKKGQTTVYLGGDISYVLRAFPNHYRALELMARLSERERTEKPQGAQWPLRCYYERALAFKPDDSIVQLLYGNYLLRKRQLDKAIEHLSEANRLKPNNANINYNLGLALFAAKRYDEAAESAQVAYALGFPLPGLRKKLESVGKWSPTASNQQPSRNRTED